MDSEISAYVGYVAASLTTASFLPQVLTALKSPDLSSISLLMYVMFVTGICCWLIYGVMLGDGPLIAANVVTLMLSASVLYLKIREVRRGRRQRSSLLCKACPCSVTMRHDFFIGGFREPPLAMICLP
jgi:MtN3 and saliva related transmembrane protein